MELKITAGVVALAGLLTKSPTLMRTSVVIGAAALVDQKVTTGHVDPREVAVTAVAAAPGVEAAAAAVSGMKEVGAVAEFGQQYTHTGAAAAGAGLAVGEGLSDSGKTSDNASSGQKQDQTSSTKPTCNDGKRC